MSSPEFLSLKAIGVLLLACVLWFDHPQRVFSQTQSNDTEAIRALVGKMFELYQQKELDKLIALWSEKSSFLADNKKALQRDFAAYEKIAMKGFDISQLEIDGDRVTMRVLAEVA